MRLKQNFLVRTYHMISLRLKNPASPFIFSAKPNSVKFLMTDLGLNYRRIFRFEKILTLKFAFEKVCNTLSGVTHYTILLYMRIYTCILIKTLLYYFIILLFSLL